MIRTVVTGAGGPSAVSFMRAVSPDRVALFAADVDPYAAGLYLVPSDRRWIVPRGDDPAFVDDLLDRCATARIDVVVPTVDTELLVLARRRDEFAAQGVRLLLANEDTLALCLDKAVLLARCADVCPIPRWSILDGEFERSAWPYPFLVKPRSGAGGRGVHLLTCDAEFALCSRTGELLAQEYLPGREYSVDVLSDLEQRVRAVVPRSRLKIDSGIAVAGRTVHDVALRAAATAVARCIGLTFVGNIQFREDAAGMPKLLEVNARFPGTMPLTVRSGVNMPQLALDLVLGEEIPADCGQYCDVAMVRTWQDHFITTSELASMEHQAHEARQLIADCT